jgi:hypothetical protein
MDIKSCKMTLSPANTCNVHTYLPIHFTQVGQASCPARPIDPPPSTDHVSEAGTLTMAGITIQTPSPLLHPLTSKECLWYSSNDLIESTDTSLDPANRRCVGIVIQWKAKEQ